MKQHEGLVASDKGAVGTARLNLQLRRIVAPIAGRVGLRPVDAGNYVAADGTTPIAVITQIEPIDVSFAVPQDADPRDRAAPELRRRPAGHRVRPRRRRGARHRAASPPSTTRSTPPPARSRPRRASPTPARALFPNQFVNVTVLVDTLQNQVIVPVTAMRHGPNGDFVYVLSRRPHGVACGR